MNQLKIPSARDMRIAALHRAAGAGIDRLVDEVARVQGIVDVLDVSGSPTSLRMKITLARSAHELLKLKGRLNGRKP